MSDEGLREKLFTDGFNYFLEHPMGAYQQYVLEGHTQAHNVFVNALLFGGIFGGIIGIGIIIYQLVVIMEVILKALRKRINSTMLVVCSLAYLDYTLNSFFHNPSVLAGVSIYFVLWSMVVTLIQKEKNTTSTI